MIAEPSEDEVRQYVKHSLALLLRHDSYLLEIDANERSISHRLALYLQETFQGWDVDCEYNRHHDEPKRLEDLYKIAQRRGSNVGMADTDARTVFPDIIVHRRGTDDNLLVIEMKKATNSVQQNDFDFEKLRAFKDQLGYRYAVFIKLWTGDTKVTRPKPEWI